MILKSIFAIFINKRNEPVVALADPIGKFLAIKSDLDN